MTTYNRSERLSWRSRCRRWRWMINAMLAVVVLATVLLAQPVQAGSCRSIPHGRMCTAPGQVYIRCEPGYEPRFGANPRCAYRWVLP